MAHNGVTGAEASAQHAILHAAPIIATSTGNLPPPSAGGAPYAFAAGAVTPVRFFDVTIAKQSCAQATFVPPQGQVQGQFYYPTNY